MAFVRNNITSSFNLTGDQFGLYSENAGKVIVVTEDTSVTPPLIEKWYATATSNGELLAFLNDFSRFVLFDNSNTGGGGAAGVNSFNGRSGVVAPQPNDYTAGLIGFTPSGNFSSTNLQALATEIDTEKASATDLQTLQTSVTNIVNGTTNVAANHSGLTNDEPQRHVPALTANTTHYLNGAGAFSPLPVTSAPNASQVPFTPVGGIGSNNTQAAVAELDTEKVNKTTAINTVNGLTGGGNLSNSLTIALNIPSLPAVPVLDNADVLILSDTETGTHRRCTVQQLLASVISGTLYNGFWNASTNTPSLADGTGSAGDFYYVSVAGTQNLGSGNISFDVNDVVIYNGTTWGKMAVTNDVVSVFGRKGAITPQANDYNSTQVSHTPSGNIAASNIGAAINELDTEKASTADLGTTNTNLGNLQTSFNNHNHAHSTITDDEAARHLPALTTSADYLRGDGSFATFPTSLPPASHTHAHSELTDDEQTRHVATSGGTNGYVLTYDSAVSGTNNKWAALPAFTPPTYEEKTAAFTAVKSHFYQVNASAALAVTLPATPTVGDEVVLRISGASDTNIITFLRNGSNLEGVADDGTVTKNGVITIRFVGTIGTTDVGWTKIHGLLV